MVQKQKSCAKLHFVSALKLSVLMHQSPMGWRMPPCKALVCDQDLGGITKFWGSKALKAQACGVVLHPSSYPVLFHKQHPHSSCVLVRTTGAFCFRERRWGVG